MKHPTFSGARMREARLRAGLSQQALAQRIGWDQSRVSAHERGKIRNPGADKMAMLARAIGCRMEDLMDG